MKILMVLTSHDTLGDTGRKTGFWLEGFAGPYYVFCNEDADVTLASPEGGQPPIDPASDAEDAQTEDTRRFRDDPEAQRALADTARLSDLDEEGFDAIFYPGGHGSLWDLADDDDSTRLIERFAAAGKPIGAVCHAPAAFKNPKGPDGRALIAGRLVTGFANSEEKAMGLTNVVPFLIQDMLNANGGHYEKGEDWASFVVMDGGIVTGQNPASGRETAHKLMALV